jgi:hypothetical protein
MQMSFIELKSIESAFIYLVENNKIFFFYKGKMSRYDLLMNMLYI